MPENQHNPSDRGYNFLYRGEIEDSTHDQFKWPWACDATASTSLIKATRHLNLDEFLNTAKLIVEN